MTPQTTVHIDANAFCINGRPTYPGRHWRDFRIEGLLLNSRMVQGIFDDRNPATRHLWHYPDTGTWDPMRNTQEFLAALPIWRAHGLVSFDICLQGGSPQGYSQQQPWHNSPFEPDGSFGAAAQGYLQRLELILQRADELAMVPMLCVFYFGQDERLEDEAAVWRALDGTIDWLLERGYTHTLIEVANEIDNRKYEQPLLRPARVPELCARVRERSAGRVNSPHGRLLTSVSLCGGRVPGPEMIAASDFVLLHGNGVSDPQRIRAMVQEVRRSSAYGGQPVVYNEDDHFDFDEPDNNFLAALSQYAGWGYFDYRMGNEGFEQGYQSVPVQWGITSARKRGFFRLLREITGA